MNKIIPIQYFFAHLFFVFGWASFYFSGIFSYSLILYGFVLLPFLELLIPRGKFFFSLDDQKNSFLYDLILYLTVPFQFFSVFYFLFTVSHFELTTYELVGKFLSMGTLCGHAINVAHELGHRKNKFEQFLSKTLLLSTLYMHFFIEHNKGHHLKVATFEDPASAKKGEWLYIFFIRSIFYQYISAWEIENKRLKFQKKRVFSIHNKMIHFLFIQLSLLLIILFSLNIFSVLMFCFASLFGIIILETINYVEHYGLVRRLKPNGRYESVSEFHSWNSDFILGRLFFFQLTLHSDHHMKATKKYQKLISRDKAPHHPTGYPGMMLLAFFPPIFFYCMDDLVDHYTKIKINQKQEYNQV